MKDITKYLMPDLVLNHHGKKYVVPPPSKDDGLLLQVLNVIGIAAASGRDEIMTDGLTDEQKAMASAMKGRDIGEVSLGPAYDEMVADGIPGPHIDMYGIYAMYYWAMGEQFADQIMEQVAGGEESGPKDQEPLKSGQPTE